MRLTPCLQNARLKKHHKEGERLNGLQIFKNEQFGEIRTVEIGGEPWFVGKDVAAALGYSNTKDALATHVDAEDKQIVQRSGNATFDIPNRGMTIINESGVYSLVFGSKRPDAKQFRHWVTSEVIPSIRKNGGYIAGQSELSDEELMARALQVANRTIERRNARIGELEEQAAKDKPKVLFADSVSASDKSILIGELAKLLKQNGVEIGQNRLFEWMRNNGYLIRRNGSDYNMPTQRAMELDLFTIKETVISHADGHTSISKTVKVTGKGQVYFINKFLGDLGT